MVCIRIVLLLCSLLTHLTDLSPFTLQRLAGVLSDGDIPLDEIEYERADLVVSALRAIPEHAPLASNWTAMLQALKNDKNSRKSSSTNQRIEMVQQRVLLRMFVTAVRMEVGDAGNECTTNVDPLLLEAIQEHQDSLTTVKPSTNVKSTKQKSKSDMHEELTIALLRSLPELLLRFKSETPVLASLTTLPQYFCKFIACTCIDMNVQKMAGLNFPLAYINFSSAECPKPVPPKERF